MKDDEILRLARERFGEAHEEDDWNRDQALDDLEFLSGEQWSDVIRNEREDANRPILTINRLPQFLRQVTGDIRKTNPAVTIMPADGDASKEVAEIYEGLVRYIEYCSDAQTVYEGAAESAAACGMGWFRVLADYQPGGFDQEIKLERIHNPFAVYMDPDARESTRADARYCFVVERVHKDDFERDYPDAKLSSWESSGLPEYLSHWYEGDRLIIAEYFERKPVKKKIGLLEDGRVIDMAEDGAALMPVTQIREIEDFEVTWYKMSGQEILEGPVKMPCRHIPVVGVVGEEMHIGERIVRSSVIRYAKDAQRLYNYWRSAQTELIALQPKAPFMATTKQIEGLEAYWDEANTANRPYLPYNADPVAPGAPQRATPPVPSSGMMQEIALAADDMKATTGIYDAALGERSNESSGIAIQQRQLESDISTSIYVDNLSKAIGHAGKIIVEMIPKIYDTTRQIQILGADDTESLVSINQPMLTPFGPVMVNDLSQGKYNVRIATGPSYSTRRQEAAQSQLEFMRTVPGVAQYVMDLVAKNMDWPGADQFADRLRKLLPPGVEERDPEDMNPQEQQAYMAEQQAAQQARQLQQQAQMIEMTKAQAEATEAEAEAKEAGLDAAIKGIELAQRLGVLEQEAAMQARAALSSIN